VGSDTKGAGSIKIKEPRQGNYTFVVEDTREGWAELVRTILDAYFGRGVLPSEIDYNQIRPHGALIKSFGGIASGPGPLIQLANKDIPSILNPLIDNTITSEAIVDLFNAIGRCVVSGNVRRSAEIMLGDPEDKIFLDLKNPTKNKKRLSEWRWTSNNSLFAKIGMDYSKTAELTAKNGEPGYFWLDTARKYGRLADPADPNKDRLAVGCNPCFSGDTLIAVADGRHAVPIKQLAKEGNDVPVYAINPEIGKIEIKWARNPRLTRKNAELLEIMLDDGATLRVTPDHKMILRDGTIKKAKELITGDSLPRLTKRPETIEKDKSKYLRMNMDTTNSSVSRLFEHRLIAKFYHAEKWKKLYDNKKQNGWIKGGVVVHHKDYNTLNNLSSNLEIMTFEDHALLHGQTDNSGDKNPMYGRKHSEETKRLIAQRVKERCEDPAYRRKLSLAQTLENRERASILQKKLQKERAYGHYLNIEATTDLKTTWIDSKLHAVRVCEECGREFSVEWGRRGQAHCSRSCANSKEQSIVARIQGQRKKFNSRQKETLDKQIDIYLKLKNLHKRDPFKIEWEKACKENKIPIRTRTKGTTKNPYALESYSHLKKLAQDHNHRVESIRFLKNKEDVYNLSVDEYHTVGIITSLDEETKSCSGIYTFQCSEQTLESYELCCLVETFPARHETFEEYERTLKFAYLYAKTVTLVPTHNARTNAVMLRNRRIGTSQSGIAQSFKRHGIREHYLWCDKGYKYLKTLDRKYSDWLCVPRSIKITSVKPSGSVSLLCHATPGIHFPYAEYYWRTMRLDTQSELASKLKKAGYRVEPAEGHNTVVAYFPVKENNFYKSRSDISMWEQLEIAAQMQYWWSDNQVSASISFKPEEKDQIGRALELYETRLKSVSFLPLADHGYKHAPYQPITKEVYESEKKKLKPLKLGKLSETHGYDSEFCDSESCQLPKR
jgi:intein/homing endonuclease